MEMTIQLFTEYVIQFLNYADDLCADEGNHLYFISREYKLLDSAKEYFSKKKWLFPFQISITRKSS